MQWAIPCCVSILFVQKKTPDGIIKYRSGDSLIYPLDLNYEDVWCLSNILGNHSGRFSDFRIILIYRTFP